MDVLITDIYRFWLRSYEKKLDFPHKSVLKWKLLANINQ